MKAIAIALFLCASCGGDATSTTSSVVPDPTLSSIQAAIFTPNCAAFTACHASANDGGHCDLTAGHAHADLVGHPSYVKPSNILVVAGHPEESFLVRKLRGQLADGEGVQMPYHSPPLSEEQIAAIEAWIANGALDD
jgi:hypothetical protein